MPTDSSIAASSDDGLTTPGVTRVLRWLLGLYIASAVGVALQRTLLSPENNFLILRAAFAHLVSGQDLYAAYPAVHADFFKYSPTFALLFAPFALLPLVPGYMLWATVCASAVFLGIRRALAPREAAWALGLSWLAVVGDLQRSQSNALCAGLMILAWASLERGADWRPALAIGVCTLVKIFPVIKVNVALFLPRRLLFMAISSLDSPQAVPLLVVSPSSLAMQYRSWLAIETRDAAPLALRAVARILPGHGTVSRVVGRPVAARPTQVSRLLV
jgi:hypothetical protein